jgi:hypothetical protein
MCQRVSQITELGAKLLIDAERRRQVEAEGWTEAHDDTHRSNEMLQAALVYYDMATGSPMTMRTNGAPFGWPWDAAWWKPKGYERDLVRAGALCVAERGRLDRLGLNAAHVDHQLDLIIAALQLDPPATEAQPAHSDREAVDA